MELQVVIRTDHGNIRENNEDSARFSRIDEEPLLSQRGMLMIVADGMGGHQAGEVASGMATEIISKEYYRKQHKGPIEKLLRNSFSKANEEIYALAGKDKSRSGMGTTCTAIVVAGEELYFGHVGDSRAYLADKETIVRITRDHTQVQEMVDNGEITASEAATHPRRNILTNAMGTKAVLSADTGRFNNSFTAGKRLLICSDGLYDYFTDDEIHQVLISSELPVAADQLISGAKSRGGHDNITVVLAMLREPTENISVKDTRDIIIPVTKEYILP